MEDILRARFILEGRQAPSTSSSGSASAATSSTSSTTAFFPSPTTVRPDTPDSKQSVPQLVLEWAFALAAILVLVLLLCCRYQVVRRRGLPVSSMFSRGGNRRAPSPDARPFRHSIRHPYGHPPPREGDILPGQPLRRALHSDALFTVPHINGTTPRAARAVQAQDVDEGGRRGGVHPDDEEDGPGGGQGGADKEILPAYDGGRDGPPKYYETGMIMGSPALPPPAAQVGRVQHLELSNLRRASGSADEHGEEPPTSATPLRSTSGLPFHAEQEQGRQNGSGSSSPITHTNP